MLSVRSGMAAARVKTPRLPPATPAPSNSASLHHLSSVAFPAISTGVYRFPADRAARIAVSTTAEALAAAPTVSKVIFCCFSPESARLHDEAMVEFGNPCAG